MKKDNKNLLWGLLAGSLVGSITALLFAPKPGKELRKDIADGATSSIEKVQGLAVQVGDKSVELYDKAKGSVDQVVTEVREWSKHCAPADSVEDTLAVSGIAETEAVGTVTEAVFAVTPDEVAEADEALAGQEASLVESGTEEAKDGSGTV